VANGLAFDKLAARYDEDWSDAAIGRCQRAAVWRWVDPLFPSGSRILDLGCGTGVDALHFLERGIGVLGIDASAEMVRLARGRGVDARYLEMEAIATLPGTFDGAISNFGALNCVADGEPVARALGRLIRPRGYLAICVMGRSCAWEILHYARRFRWSKAFRRWNPAGAAASIGVQVYYPSVRRLRQWFQGDFELAGWYGIGLAVPPSYVRGLSDAAVARLAAVDRRVAHLPLLQALCDHRLLLFQRRGEP
jgi:SAM-dependent methyltransferase